MGAFFMPGCPAGAGFTSLWESHKKTGGPSSVKIREIDRPGVLRVRRETKTHEKEARRNRDLCDISHVFLLVPTKYRTGTSKKQAEIMLRQDLTFGAI